MENFFFLNRFRVKKVFLSVPYNLEMAFHTMLFTFLLKKLGAPAFCDEF